MSATDQDEIASMVKRLVPDRSAARRCAEGAATLDKTLWMQLAELGLLGVALPDTRGGLGFGLVEESVIAENLGRAVAPVPIISTCLATHVLGAGAENDVSELCEDLRDGRRIIGVALSTQGDIPHAAFVGDRLVLDEVDLFEGADIDLLLVHADDRWWSVDLQQEGVTCARIPSVDATRPIARVSLDHVIAKAVSRAPADRIRDIAYVLIAAEALGAAQSALDLTCSYALDRHQFDQPIGRFQAIKQKMADCLLCIEAARSAIWGALRSVKDGWPDPTAARLAKVKASTAVRFTLAETVQMHGAIGCTWEHDLHLLMRRGKHCELSLGSADEHLGTLGEQVLADASTAGRGRRSAGEDMDLGFVPGEEDEAFIAEFRSWLDEHAPAERLHELKRSGLSGRREWQAELADSGWAALHWARSAGGREASFTQQVLYYAEMAKRGLPPLAGNRGLMLVGPTLIAHGTAFQKQLLEPTRRADILWAGGFSERGAGSDLASLRTRGVIDGDDLVINGHKIWTSQAQIADWLYALIRTGPLRPKHEGISVVLIPMNTPGVEVRPIRRNNGDFHFNEIFFDDARVPLTHVVGPLNAGWSINRTTMVGEHLTNFLGSQAAQVGTLSRIARVIAERESRFGIDHALRHRLASAWATTQIVRLHGLRNVARFTAGDSLGAEASISKLVGQENEKLLFELMVDAQGPSGLEDGTWTRAYLSTRASTIGGGTSEIHRNKLAERVLGMPRDPWAEDETPVAPKLAVA